MGVRERKRNAFITVLLDCGGNIKEAAARLECAESTLHRHLLDPHFTRAYHQARARLLDTSISQIANVLSDGVRTLHDIIKNTGESAAPRVSAVKVALDFAVRGLELADLRLRVESLEEKLK